MRSAVSSTSLCEHRPLRSPVRLASAVAILGIACLTCGSSTAWAQESKVEATRAAATRAPANAETYLALGRSLRRAGRTGEALEALRRGQGTAPRPATATALLWETARAHVDRRAFAPATAACRELAKVPGATSAAHVCTAEAHLLWRRASEAMVALDAVAKDAKVSPEVLYAAKLALGRARELETRDEGAEEAYRAAVGLAPDRSEAHVALGVLLRRTKPTSETGVAELRRAVELDASDPEALRELGRALPAGSAEQIAALERASSERPDDADALRLLADAYLLAKRFPEAKRAAEAALRVAPNDAPVQVALGRIALGEGKTDEALRAGAVAFERTKNFAPAKLLVADANAKKGEIDLAIEAYQAAVGLDRTDATALLRATAACLAAGRTTSAKAFAERAVHDFPEHAAAWDALGDALAADGEPARARTAWETARTKPGADVAAFDRKIAALRLR